jgi:hypothetical protein
MCLKCNGNSYECNKEYGLSTFVHGISIPTILVSVTYLHEMMYPG